MQCVGRVSLWLCTPFYNLYLPGLEGSRLKVRFGAEFFRTGVFWSINRGLGIVVPGLGPRLRDRGVQLRV